MLQRDNGDLGVTVEIANLIKEEEDSGSAIKTQGQGVKEEEESDKGVPLLKKSPISDDWGSHVQKQKGNGEETGEED